jgi:hypothetical protein
MNTKYPKCPDVIADLRGVNRDGDDTGMGARIVGIQILRDSRNQNSIAQIDIRDFKPGENLIVEIELPELAAALSLATLHAER